ncbi:MAG: flagellar hook-length control protein FliK [Methylococcaceae bacterium]|nr:flagellar hook-length control protein FliK [Methylococcaceae bacterium]
MDINQTQTQKKQLSSLAASNKDVSSLKLNQLIEARIINVKSESRILTLQTSQSAKPIQVQSNLSIDTKPGQTLQLLVTKVTPAAEFKVLSSDAELKSTETFKSQETNKPINIKDLVLKQIIPANEIQKSRGETKTFETLTLPLITAKIISISNDKIQLKLYTHINAESKEYSKSLQQNVLQKNNPIITLTKQQLSFSDTKAIESRQATSDFLSFKPGQKIQLEVKQQGNNPEFKIIDKLGVKLIPGQVITTKVIAINNNTLQLQSSEKKINQFTEFSLNVKQLSYSIDKHSRHLSAVPFTNSENFRIGQQLKLEVTKPGLQPEFKILDIKSEKLSAGQIISAKIIDIKDHKIQLQLSENNQKNDKLNSSKATQPIIISLNKSQITYSKTEFNTSVNTPLLIKGQQVKLEIIKTGTQTEFKLLQSSPTSPQKKIQDTIKQLLPIQDPPPVLLNQIIKNLNAINNNKNIPDTLKQLAKEILDSLPQQQSLNNSRQLKHAISNSGLFLEAKIAQYAKNNNLNLTADFKILLLKFQHGLKHQLKLKLEKNEESSEINLLKEMQQKTENTLARMILNQLASLPKEENLRQVWILDLPFLHKDNAESVKIEIDRDQQNDNDEKQQNWTVSITVTPPKSGTIHCKISCFDKTVNTRFWSDNPETVAKISTHLDYLKVQLEQAGINTGHMSAHRGILASDIQQKISGQSLFDQEV